MHGRDLCKRRSRAGPSDHLPHTTRPFLAPVRARSPVPLALDPPSSQLVDMYHTREATDPLDKVYALLGIGAHDATKLSANYRAPWEAVFQRLIQFSLSDRVSVRVSGAKRGVAVIRARGYLLGRVSVVRGEDSRGEYLARWHQLGECTRRLDFQIKGTRFCYQEDFTHLTQAYHCRLIWH